MTIEEKLRKLMLEQHQSIRAFAFAIDMKQSTVYSILERGVANSSFANVMKICNSLDISADYLMEGRIERKKL